MDKQRIAYLHQQYLNDALTVAERQEWTKLLLNPKAQHDLQQLAYTTWDGMDSTDSIPLNANRSEEIFRHIVETPQTTHKRITLLSSNWFRSVAVAASIVLVLATSIWLFHHVKNNVLPSQQFAQNDIAPGAQGATLTLSNGKKIKLNNAVNGQLAQEAGVSINKTADGQLIYEIVDNGNDDNKINELATANGETYQVRLPDGSLVWLNAASSIKYPANFATLKERGERRVQLNGEAYFEVAKDPKHPFIVSSGGQEIKVLGTHFNVNNYAERPIIKTTLLEGSVQVSALRTEQSRILKPGQEAKFNGQAIDIANVDAEEAVAWKNGYFQFSGKTLEEAMQEVARWYDVEVVYKNEKLKSKPLAGTISKYGTISTVLKTMKLAGAMNFTISNKKIIVE